jgi:ABC-type phosphate transport system substrate-binding protein
MQVAMSHANCIARSSIIIMGLLVASSPVSADVVAVVSSKSTVTTLNRSQVEDIFLGKTTRFPDGSRAEPIDQSEGTTVRDEFYTKLTGKSAAQMKAYWSKIIFTGRGQPPKTLPNAAEVKKRLAENPAAIGYIDVKLVDASVRVVF